MFDDPKKDLQELEGQLLAAEMNQDQTQLDENQFEALYDGILKEFGPQEDAGGSAVSSTDPPIRNFANGYGRAVPQSSDADEVPPADIQPEAPKKGIKGLVFIACAECLVIAAVAVYWVLNIL